MKLIKTAVDLIKKYRELIMYGIFGVLTTIVNFASYAVLTKVLSLNYIIATVIAWVLAVAFAYITNKIFVFESKDFSFKYVVKEMISFFICRAVSGGFDILCMYIFVDIFGVNDLLMKILSNIIVVIINYVLSKIYIFKNKKQTNRVK